MKIEIITIEGNCSFDEELYATPCVCFPTREEYIRKKLAKKKPFKGIVILNNYMFRFYYSPLGNDGHIVCDNDNSRTYIDFVKGLIIEYAIDFG